MLHHGELFMRSREGYTVRHSSTYIILYIRRMAPMTSSKDGWRNLENLTALKSFIFHRWYNSWSLSECLVCSMSRKTRRNTWRTSVVYCNGTVPIDISKERHYQPMLSAENNRCTIRYLVIACKPWNEIESTGTCQRFHHGYQCVKLAKAIT